LTEVCAVHSITFAQQASQKLSNGHSERASSCKIFTTTTTSPTHHCECLVSL